ncbi:MAG: hypothetical protein ACFCUU_09440 [Cyclobacteriaceae bacterium]
MNPNIVDGFRSQESICQQVDSTETLNYYALRAHHHNLIFMQGYFLLLLFYQDTHLPIYSLHEIPKYLSNF